MFEVLKRILLHPIDYGGVFRSRTLTLKEYRAEDGLVHSFFFTPDRPISWKAGQHGVFTMPDENIEGTAWRAFSIAAAPYENVIQIGTTIPPTPSDFKLRLLELTPGDTVCMHGPFGEFYLRPGVRSVVGVAGGIGITPLRSLIADATYRELSIPITLIYAANESHTYREELDRWCTQNPHLKVQYVHTPDEVNQALTEELCAQGNAAHYYLSGSPGMVAALIKTCKQHQVKNIINDPFKGY